MESKRVKYQPIFARVLIEREITKKTTGGIFIPDGVAKRHAKCEGTIIALGETASEVLKIGQRVKFGVHAGTWLDGTLAKEDEDGTLFLCQDEDILAIINEPEQARSAA